jgi:hypothetical protein
MVKQAEKDRKRNPLLPVFGLILAIGLFALAYFLVDPAVKLLNSVRHGAIPWPPPQDSATLETLAIAFALWLIFLIIVYTFVAIASGKDPNSAKGLQLPPRTKEERNRRYK